MLMKVSPQVNELNRRLDDKTATVGVCGLGYVGLPLAVAAAGAGFRVIGFDIDEAKTRALNGGLASPKVVKA